MEFVLKSFKELSIDELYSLLKLRATIFVVEQNCAYLDLDDKDQDSLHLLGYNNKKLVAYARLVAQGVSYKDAPSIGRVVVDINYRGKNAGKELMLKAIEETLSSFNSKQIVISAQQYLEKFYGDLGFVTESEAYMEDFIPHLKMRLVR
jgi:ElaA protein